MTSDENRKLPDCNWRERAILVAVVVVILVMGTYPQPFLRRLENSVAQVVRRVEPATVTFVSPAALPERTR